jgi:hypothetical protein
MPARCLQRLNQRRETPLAKSNAKIVRASALRTQQLRSHRAQLET